MPNPHLARSLVTLRHEVNALFPQRDKASDGWLGDTSHQTRPSSHNPNAQGVVRALDLDVDDNDPRRDLRALVLDAAIGDPRVWYVISNGVIYSRTRGFEPRPYPGPNGHFTHVHVSLRETPEAWNDSRPWLDRKEDDMPRYTEWPEEDRKALADDVANAIRNLRIERPGEDGLSLGGAIRCLFNKAKA